MSLEDELTEELRGTYEAARKRGYVATYFPQILEERGGTETAKRLLGKSEPQTGLFELYNRELLHESMEAVIWDNPKYHVFFTPEELREAYQRLEQLKYFEKDK